MTNLLWMMVAFDWTEVSATSLLEPRTVERDEVIDLDEILARSAYTFSARMWIADTLGDAITPCVTPLSRLAKPFHLTPYAHEVDHWSAVRLTPDSYPFRVDEITYYLGHEGTKDATLPHTVALYVSDSDTPPADHRPIADVEITLTTATAGTNSVTWTLDAPFELYAGEHLYVTIQHTGDWPARLSVLTCPVAGAGGWWSNAVDQPYDWEVLTNFGVYSMPMVTASGYQIIE